MPTSKRFFYAIRWLQMSGKVPATRRKRSNRRTRAEARRWRRPFSTFSDCKRRLRLRVRHPHGVTRRTSNVDLKARIFKARRLLQMLDDVSQLSRVALLAVHAPRRSRQAALVALLKTLAHPPYKIKLSRCSERMKKRTHHRQPGIYYEPRREDILKDSLSRSSN